MHRTALCLTIAAFALAACATAPTAPTNQGSATQVPQEFKGLQGDTKPSAKYFPAEVHEAVRQMQIGTLQSCKGSKSVGELNTCFRNSIVTGFDTSGRGAGACGSIEDLGKFASCIMEGNLAMSFYSLMPAGEVEPMTDSDWLDPKPYVDRLDIAMTLQVTKSCLEASASDTAGCVRDKIENFLNLSASDRQRCDTVQPAADFKQCVAEAIGVRTLREGTARITAKSI